MDKSIGNNAEVYLWERGPVVLDSYLSPKPIKKKFYFITDDNQINALNVVFTVHNKTEYMVLTYLPLSPGNR